jgi:WD40 repeat protein
MAVSEDGSSPEPRPEPVTHHAESDPAADPARFDAFISYRRIHEDTAFVDHLEEDLAARGKWVWVDRAKIEPAADWSQRIERGIRNAKALIFVITPESAASKDCLHELQLATELNKLIIPVVLREVDRRDLPESLNRPNWIFFSPGHDTEQALGQVTEALEEDLPWRDSHTRLAARTKEWTDAKRDRSFLLRGNDLRAAEDWLSQASQHQETPPTALQTEYIVASRKAAVRTQRTWRGALSAGLVIALGLAAVAFWQREEAQAARDRAQTQAALATSRYLAAESVAESGAHPSLGLLLAAYGLKLTDTTEARSAMLSSLWQRPQLLEVLEDHADRAWAISMLAYSPDGRRLAVASHDGTVVQWDVATGRPIGKPLGGAHNADALTPQWIMSVAYSPQGTQIAAGSGSGELTIWDADTGRKITSANFGVPVRSLAYSPDGALLAAGFEDNAGTVAVFPLGTSKPPRLFRVGDDVFSVAFSPDGKLLAAGDESGDIDVWNLADPRAAPLYLSGGDAAQDLAFSPGGKLLACACGSAGIRLWPVRGTETAGKTLGQGPYAYGVAFSRDGKTLASAGDDGYVRLWNLATLGQETPPLLASWKDYVYTVAFNPVTDTLASGSGDGQLLLWSERARWPLGTSVFASGPDASVAAVSENGDLLAVTTARGAALWGDQTGREIGPLPSLPGHPTSAAFNASGTSVLVGYDKGEVAVYDVKTRRLVVQGRPMPGGQSVQSVAFSADGTVLIATDNAAPGHLDLWNARTGAPIGPPINTGAAIEDLAANPQLNIAATANFDATVRLWDARTGKQRGSVTGHNDSVQSVSFSSNGRYLASAGLEGTVIVTDVTTGRTVSTLPITGVDIIALDATGTTLAAATDTTVQLWDVATASEIGPPFPLGVPVTALSFTDDGDLISALATNPPQIIRWNFDASTWIQTACAIANRDLTVQERDQFLGAGFSGTAACGAA